MKYLRIVFCLGAVAAIALASSSISAQSPGSHIYYIDFDNGSDSANGASQNSAWKHAPGDPQATGAPAKINLMPGDTVLFKGGVTYRGSIPINASGAPGRPITYSGQGWGSGRAIISGRDPIDSGAQACSSEPTCAKLQNPDQFVVFKLATPITTYSQVVLDGHVLHLSQAPEPSQPGWFDDIGSYAIIPQDDLTQLADKRTWQIKNDVIRKTLGDAAIEDMLVLIWGYPGVVTSSPAISYDPASSLVQFQTDNFKRNTYKDAQFSLQNHPRFISLPYEYATVGRGSLIIIRAPTTSSKLEVSRRAWCFTAVGQKNIAINGFVIEGFADGPRGGGGSALAVRDTENISFTGNDVHDLDNWAGGGAVSGEPVSGIDISNNRFANFPHGSGIRIGKGANVKIARNQFDNIGRTGIMVQNSQSSLVDHNSLRGLFGSHGNGISIYGSNTDAMVSNNAIMDATRAITFEGNGHPENRNNVTFKANLVRSTGGAPLQSWGGNMNGVVIEQNVLLIDQGVQGLRLSGKDSDVAVRRNVIDGYQGSPWPLPSDTTIKDNVFVSNSRGSIEGNELRSGFRKEAEELFSGRENPEICKFLIGNGDTAGIGPNDLCRSH